MLCAHSKVHDVEKWDVRDTSTPVTKMYKFARLHFETRLLVEERRQEGTADFSLAHANREAKRTERARDKEDSRCLTGSCSNRW